MISEIVFGDIQLSASSVATAGAVEARMAAFRTAAMHFVSSTTQRAPRDSAMSRVLSVQRFKATTTSTGWEAWRAATTILSMQRAMYFSSLCAGIVTERIGFMMLNSSRRLPTVPQGKDLQPARIYQRVGSIDCCGWGTWLLGCGVRFHRREP